MRRKRVEKYTRCTYWAELPEQAQTQETRTVKSAPSILEWRSMTGRKRADVETMISLLIASSIQPLRTVKGITATTLSLQTQTYTNGFMFDVKKYMSLHGHHECIALRLH